MNADEIIARAAPPPERADASVFEPVATDADSLARRRDGLTKAFGSPAGLAAHAEALGLAPDAWVDRFRDVRLAGPAPDWGRAFRAVFERVSDGPKPFAEVRRWAQAEARAAWPAGLPAGPEVLEGPLDHLAMRIGTALHPTYRLEYRLGHQPTWRKRFERSPALGYAIGRVTADWLADLARTLRRAADDRALLARAFFGGEDPGALAGIEPGLGDSHAGGCSVAILRFERGGVVYKPKDLRVAVAVGEIADRLTGTGLAPPATLARDGYAWEPVYEAHPIAGRGEADAFYGALGGWLALLQALGGSDFWFDNLIADGAVPRFVDFETAVQPPLVRPAGMRRLAGEAAALVEVSPLGAGILPLLMPTRDGEDPADLGCVARPGEHRTPLPDHEGGLVTWREERFAPRYAGGPPADAADHFDAFEEGYLRVARGLAAPALQARAVETLQRIADAPIRIVRIDTWTCYRAIHRSLAPRHLSDGAWREIALHAVVQHAGEVTGELREGAVRDLRRLDVPLFQTRLDSRDLCGIEGGRLRGFFERDAISATPDRLRALAALPEDERIALLRSGFGMRAGNPARRPPGKGRLPPAGAGDLLAWADEIATQVARRAVTDDRGAPAWIGLVHDVFTDWRIVGSIGFDVLSGRAGLGLALLELARALGRSDLAGLAREALAGAGRDHVDHARTNRYQGAGYAVGAGGLVATLAREPALRPLAVEVWRCASSHEVWMRSGGDFASGLAGWREAARAVGEPAPARHGPNRPYAPLGRRRLAPWLTPESAASPCSDRRMAARLRQDRDRHGSWFAGHWLDDRHNLSGVDGLPALAVRFTRLARAATTSPDPSPSG